MLADYHSHGQVTPDFGSQLLDRHLFIGRGI